MRNLLSLVDITSTHEVQQSRSPIIIAVALVYAATVFSRNSYEISIKATIVFTILMCIHLLMYLYSDKLFKRKYWLYFGIQGIIVFACAAVMSKGYDAIFLGLIPVIIIHSMIIYYDALRVIITSAFFYMIFCGTILLFDGTDKLIHNIPIFILITIGIRAYFAIFLNQVRLRINAQKVLKDLELANEKVEELTLINERQRIARDLHDTLSQGLAGIIMQLDAVDANLKKANTQRAQEIVQKAMEQARKALSDSRLVIDDLRSRTSMEMNFNKAIANEIDKFKIVSNTFITSNIKVESELPVNVSKHILFIIREALNNIAKHAKAKNAKIDIIENPGQINIDIADDGIGFDIKLLDQMFGHYGIIGMTERVKAIGGKLKIKSKRKAGTDLNIIIPIRKGTFEEDEQEKNIGSR